MTRDELDRLWQDPQSWRGWTIYYCEDDPRIIVPKRLRWTGYTINFAHKMALPILASIVSCVLAPFALLAVIPFPASLGWVAGAFFAMVACTAGLCHWESTRTR